MWFLILAGLVLAGAIAKRREVTRNAVAETPTAFLPQPHNNLRIRGIFTIGAPLNTNTAIPGSVSGPVFRFPPVAVPSSPGGTSAGSGASGGTTPSGSGSGGIGLEQPRVLRAISSP